MTTLLTIRPPRGDTYRIAYSGSEFVEPDTSIDNEIDTSEWWALPGLADAHAHLTMSSSDDIHGISEEAMGMNLPVNAWAHVESGVLLILDKGANTDLSLSILDHDAGLRPSVEAAGGIIHPDGGYPRGFGHEVEPDDLVEFVRTRADTRGGWVKIVADWPRKGLGPLNNYPLETLTEAVAVAHAAGARVAAHTMADGASDAVAAGVDSIEHGPYLTKSDIRALADRGGSWVPTVANMLKFATLLGAESTGGRMFLQGLENMRENLPLAEEVGLTVLAGTDMAVPHGDVAIEAMRLRDYGLSHRAAAEATSTNAYAYVGRPNSIAPGNVADVVFFEENPFENVATLAHPALIIHLGKVILQES
ncbi:MAG: amidohydrolase family protein [Actinomycetia bacterium]|nr:amidohydrolase family protein [Actinomycetes bacterium]